MADPTSFYNAANVGDMGVRARINSYVAKVDIVRQALNRAPVRFIQTRVQPLFTQVDKQWTKVIVGSR